ncbi:MAG TPA: hypothetical protein DCZ95_18200 [Verrucomicrobia bacterium]|nr:hypothetical protein [Verrucomicrobiota bacterium]
MKPWTDEYIEIPFVCDGRDRSGCDCWGLVRLVYAERLGINLPSFPGTLKDGSVASLKRAARLAEQQQQMWVKVADPQPFDVILFGAHVGLYVSQTEMLHIEIGKNSCVQDHNGLEFKSIKTGYFRHAKRV